MRVMDMERGVEKEDACLLRVGEGKGHPSLFENGCTHTFKVLQRLGRVRPFRFNEDYPYSWFTSLVF